MTRSPRKIPPALARVRKGVPPPGKIIENRKTKLLKRAKEDLRRELKEARVHKFS